MPYKGVGFSFGTNLNNKHMATLSEKLMELHDIRTLSQDLVSGASEKLKENKAILKRIRARQQEIYQRLIDSKGDEESELYVIKIVNSIEHVSSQEPIVGNVTNYKKSSSLDYTAFATRNDAVDYHWKKFAQYGQTEPEPMEFVTESMYLSALEFYYKGQNTLLNRISKLLA